MTYGLTFRNLIYSTKFDSRGYTDVTPSIFEREYQKGKKKYSTSSINYTKMSFKKFASLHECIFKDLQTDDLQAILDDCSLSYAYFPVNLIHSRVFREICVSNT